MDEAARRVIEAARNARSTDDLVQDEFRPFLIDESDEVPLDEETLDERASTQMGERWESRRSDED